MSDLLAECTALLQREALLLDTQNWDHWLELFTDDCEYWVPSWKGEHQTTENPRSELSLIYYKNRAGLADRVWRVRHGRSVASAVLPRTHHVISNVTLAPAGSTGMPASGRPPVSGPMAVDAVAVDAYWTTHQFLVKENQVEVLFGRYRHELVRRPDGLRLARKTIIVLNDYLPARLDFYSL